MTETIRVAAVQLGAGIDVEENLANCLRMIDQAAAVLVTSVEKAREWGLYVSTSNGKTSTGLVEPDMFIEPGLYLIRADGTLYFGTVQTMPFARPSFAEILAAIDRVLEVNYPARGEVVSIA